MDKTGRRPLRRCMLIRLDMLYSIGLVGGNNRWTRLLGNGEAALAGIAEFGGNVEESQALSRRRLRGRAHDQIRPCSARQAAMPHRKPRTDTTTRLAPTRFNTPAQRKVPAVRTRARSRSDGRSPPDVPRAV